MSGYPTVRLKRRLPVLSDYKTNSLILINGDEKDCTEGAITTVDLYESFAINPAHLLSDGRIMSYGRQIGSREDIEITPADAQ